MAKRDLTAAPVGATFGRLTILGYVRQKGPYATWRARCACGIEKEFRAQQIVSEKTKSCGCYSRDLARLLKMKHGKTKTPIYNAWRMMLARCNNPRSPEFKNYGARDITICERWLSFDNFLADMGERPSDRHSLDRINNDGNYEPQNCRWATLAEQSRNRRTNVWVSTPIGEMTLGEAAAFAKVSFSTMRWRIKRGLPMGALLAPPLQRGKYHLR